MKIVKTDNFNRDTVDDVLICENVNDFFGKRIVSYLNHKYGGEHSNDYFELFPDDYKLYKCDWE